MTADEAVVAVFDALEDREDIRNILAVRGQELDWAYLRRWSTEHGTAALLQQILDSIPPIGSPSA